MNSAAREKGLGSTFDNSLRRAIMVTFVNLGLTGIHEEGISMKTFVDQLVAFATSYGLKIVGAVLTLIIGRLLAGLARKGVKRLLQKAKTDVALIPFLSGLAYFSILVFAVIAALAKFGVQTTSLVAVLGAAGFAIGLALQGSLANFAAGVMLLIFRPFNVGDVVEAAGVLGTVKAIHIFNSELATPDNIKIVVPNGKIFGDIIKNITGYETRRVDLVFGIGPAASISKAYEVIQREIREDQRILSDPAPQIAVSEFADSKVSLVVRPWVKKEDYWGVRFDLTRKIKEQFDASGIEIPFPQHVVHLSQKADVR
jgi:small conductance mechanosensitive channel